MKQPSVSLNLRVKPEVKLALQEEGKKSFRSVSQMVRLILDKWMKENHNSETAE